MNCLTILPLAWRNIAARPGRSLGAAAGLALGVAIYLALTSLSQGYAGLVHRPLAQLKSDAIVQKPGPPRLTGAAPGVSLPPGNSVFSPGEAARLKNLPLVGSLSPALLLWERSPVGFTAIVGFDPRGPRRGAALVQGWIIRGRPLDRRPGRLLMEKHFARVHGLKVGDRWRLGGRPFTIGGLVEMKAGGALSAGNVFVTLETACSLAGLPPGSFNQIFVSLKAGVEVDSAARELARVLPGAVLTSADSIDKMMRGFGLISDRFSRLLGLLSLAFAGLLYVRLLTGVLTERSGEVGIMKTLGWRRREISQALAAESMLLGLAGALLGLALGWLSAWGMGELGVGNALPWNLNPLPAGVAAGNAAGGRAAVDLPVVFSWPAASVSLAFGLVLSALTAWWTGRKVFRATVLTSLSRP